MINGIQQTGVGTSAKHFFANNQETNRNSVNTIISERAMREIYLKGWQIVVKASNPWTIMSSYNLVNGPYTSENPELLRTILKDEWGFKGYKFSDNPPLTENAQLSREAAAESMVLLKNQGNALPIKAESKLAVFGNNQVDLVAGGTGSGDVTKMYTVPLADGLFKAGYQINPSLYSAYANYIKSEKAKQPKRSSLADLMSPITPIQEMSISIAAIQKAAAASSIAIIAIGRNAGEGNDRKEKDDYYLTEKELKLIADVSSVFHQQNKKVVVTLNIGGVIDVVQWRDKVDAILLAWQPGLEGGNAIADVISGKVNPSGKLATTFPAKYSDDYSAKNFPGKEIPGSEKPGLFGQKQVDAEVIYEEGIYVGYRYFSSFKIPTAYPFGYGLSYTNFSLSNLSMSKAVLNDKIDVKLTVTNTGKVAGKEVVQMYITAPKSNLDKPAVELKAFAKTKLLKPGESQVVEFTISANELSSFNAEASAFIAEAGDYTIKFGHAEAALISGSFKLPNDVVMEKVNKVLVPKMTINELRK
jgi:beta-glucosidase